MERLELFLRSSGIRWGPAQPNLTDLKESMKDSTCWGDRQGRAFQYAVKVELTRVDACVSSKVEEVGLRYEIMMASFDQEGGRDDEKWALLVRDVDDLSVLASTAHAAAVLLLAEHNRLHAEAYGALPACDPLASLSQYTFTSSQALWALRTCSKLEQKRQHLRSRTAAHQCALCFDNHWEPVPMPCGHRCCRRCLAGHSLHDLCSASLMAAVQQLVPEASADSRGLAYLLSGHSDPQRAQAAMRAWHTSLGSMLQEDHACRCPVCSTPSHSNWSDLLTDSSPAAAIDVKLCHHGTEAAHAKADSGCDDEKQQEWACFGGADDTESTESVSELYLTEAGSRCDAHLLTPQDAAHTGKLTIVLDIDGTLVSALPVSRADDVPANVRCHHVAKGSALNPAGVLVLERPGLAQFLEAASQLGELAVFTAGVPGYAKPIISAIDPTGKYFGDRVVCRDGTTATRFYPCVKDLSRLGRDATRTVLVDDTPLAFLLQPDHGIPVLPFQGDPEDRVLMDAVLPILATLTFVDDVRPYLNKRFGSAAWFLANGYLLPELACESTTTDSDEDIVCGDDDDADAHVEGCDDGNEHDVDHDARGTEDINATMQQEVDAALEKAWPGLYRAPGTSSVLVCDLDNCLLPYDVTKQLVQTLSPELAPMLECSVGEATCERPGGGGADAVLVNAVLREMQTRGVSVRAMKRALVRMGKDMPPSVLEALAKVTQKDCSVCVLSSCSNELFVRAVLKGASLTPHVAAVVTKPAETGNAHSAEATPSLGQSLCQSPQNSRRAPASSRLVVRDLPDGHIDGAPCFGCATGSGKHMYLRALAQHHRTLCFVASSCQDACAISELRPTDVAFVAKGSEAFATLAQAMAPVACRVVLYDDVTELAAYIPDSGA